MTPGLTMLSPSKMKNSKVGSPIRETLEESRGRKISKSLSQQKRVYKEDQPKSSDEAENKFKQILKEEQKKLEQEDQKTKLFDSIIVNKKMFLNGKELNKLDESEFGDISQRSNPTQQEMLEQSYPELLASEIMAVARQKRKTAMKPLKLNIIFAGAVGVGKTSFIKMIIDSKFKTYTNLREGEPTKKVKSYYAFRKEGNTSIELNLIDTPGYGEDLDLKTWHKIIKKEAKGRVDQNLF